MAELSHSVYYLVGGEESYSNKLSQSPLSSRKLENFIPSLSGQLEQKKPSFSFSIAGETITSLYPYKRVEDDGTITRLVIAATASGKVYKFTGAGTTATQIFPGSGISNFPVLRQTPTFVQATNNLLYFTDGERWYVTDGTGVVEGGLPHPIDAPTFVTAAGTLTVKTARYYWVSWVDIDSGEFLHWGSSSPRSASTGALTSQKVTITRPNHPPPRASHWLLFASETDDDGVFGSLLAVVPVATTTFEDQSPFLDEAGSAMVAIRRPIRNGVMVPADFATLHKGRIFALGFNKLPYVIRNPSFEDSSGATLNGWGLLSSPSTTPVTVFDGQGALVLDAAGDGVEQAADKILKPGRRYRIEVAGRETGTGTIELRSAADGLLASATITGGGAGTWARDAGVLTTTLSKIPSDLKLRILWASGTLVADFVRVWEMVPPSQVAYSALEEVEGLRNGRGEESFPGSTPTPNDEDTSDIINLLQYPQEASELVSAVSYNDSLVIFSDTSGVPILGDSFDDFGFSEQVTLAVGAAHRFAVTKSRHGLFFVSSDNKVYQASLDAPVREISRPLRRDIAKVDSSSDVWLGVHDYGERSWLVLSHVESGGSVRKLRLYDLETGQWFKFTEWTSPRATAAYEPVVGKRVLLVAEGGNVQVVDDPLSAYAAGAGNTPVATFRQALLDLDHSDLFKVWKSVGVHSDGTPSATFWLDPADPDITSGGTPLPLQALESLAELKRGFLSQLADAHGKRLLLEITLPASAAAKKLFGVEVTAETTTRYSR